MTHTPSESQARLPLGELVVIPPEHEAEAVVARMRHWDSSLKPWDLYECRLAQGVARETIRQERHHQQEILLRHAQARRADACWDEDRRGEADRLAHGMARHPALIIPQLRRTRHGCELLAERWEMLRDSLDERGVWSAAERLLALNLLGVPPELRKSVTPLDARGGADPIDHLRTVVAAQVRRHRDLAAALAPIDALEREAARLGLGPDTPELANLRKEERASSRQLAWCRSQFKTSRPESRPPDLGDLPASESPRSRPPASWVAALTPPPASPGSAGAADSSDPASSNPDRPEPIPDRSRAAPIPGRRRRA